VEGVIGINVKGCHSPEWLDDCSLLTLSAYDEPYCQHPGAPPGTAQDHEKESCGTAVAPNWCPLRDNKFTIALV